MLLYAIFSENVWFQTKRFTGLLELKQLYKQTPLEKFLIFSKYQNYTLALVYSLKGGKIHMLNISFFHFPISCARLPPIQLYLSDNLIIE